jgi:PAS domain S-box-containing protein
MRPLRSLRSGTSRAVAVGQLVSLAVGTVVLIILWPHNHTREMVALFACTTIAGLLTLYAQRAAGADRRDLEDAQRVLQRMWWLGQQITLELNPQRVLDRFLEAVMDMAQGDGATVGLIDSSGQIRLVLATGISAPLEGSIVPATGSAMARVIHGGEAIAIANIHADPSVFDPSTYARSTDKFAGLAIVPISRRGERIGAVSVATRAERRFTSADLERIEAMGDLLSVSLENAELVETLRRTEARYRTLFRAAPDAVLTVEQGGEIRDANDAVRDVTGLEPQHAIGQAIADLVVDSDCAKLSAALDAAFAGSPARVEVAFRNDGLGVAGRRVVAVAMSRLPETDPPSVLLVGRDVTNERDMRVRLMESDRLAAVGELVAGVAHEVNNPLSSISAFAQLLLRDGGLTPAQCESIEVIKSETLRASQVVKDLLAFARRSDALREPLDLNNVLSRTLRLRGYQLSSHHVELDTELAADLPAVVGDARQLQQVCLNLMTNAIQAMSPMGGGKLHVSTRHDAGWVVLEMRDTGPGIPDAARVHIFEPFFTTKDEGEGTGLGLSVSYGIVTAHGGTIAVANTSPAGTTFRVALPAAAEPALDSSGPDAGAIVRRSPLSGLRVLFIDDEPTLRAGVQTFGKMRGFTVLTASDGIEGIELIRQTPVDAVVCDLRMPLMDGPAFHERLRRERPGLAARTMFITGDVVGTGGRTGLGTVRQPILPKPFALERLEEMLVSLMRGTPVVTAAGRS